MRRTSLAVLALYMALVAHLAGHGSVAGGVCAPVCGIAHPGVASELDDECGGGECRHVCADPCESDPHEHAGEDHCHPSLVSNAADGCGRPDLLPQPVLALPVSFARILPPTRLVVSRIRPAARGPSPPSLFLPLRL